MNNVPISNKIPGFHPPTSWIRLNTYSSEFASYEKESWMLAFELSMGSYFSQFFATKSLTVSMCLADLASHGEVGQGGSNWRCASSYSESCLLWPSSTSWWVVKPQLTYLSPENKTNQQTKQQCMSMREPDRFEGDEASFCCCCMYNASR